MATQAPHVTPPGEIALGLAAVRNGDNGFGYYARKNSRLEPTAWVALTRGAEAPRALEWLIQAQGDDGLLRDDRRAPVNYGFNGCAMLALLSDQHTHAYAERVGRALLHIEGLAFPPDPVFRQDNSLKAWPWVDRTLSWVEPTAYCLLAIKRARQLGLLQSVQATLRTRIDVAERMLQDRACASGGWNYGNSKVFGTDLLAHGPTTALALLSLQDRHAVPFVQAGVDFLTADLTSERSGLALALASICLRRFNRPAETAAALIQTQLPVSTQVANTVALAALSIALSDDAGALEPFTVAF